jgi:enoyl-[acyl-carrier protein] reductase I
MRVILCLFLCSFFLGCADGFRMTHIATSRLTQSKIKIQSAGSQSHEGLKVQMKGKTVFVAGVADSTGYGWAIAKSCAEAGARVLLGTWPPMMPLFEPALNAGKFDEDLTLPDGSKMEIAKV